MGLLNNIKTFPTDDNHFIIEEHTVANRPSIYIIRSSMNAIDIRQVDWFRKDNNVFLSLTDRIMFAAVCWDKFVAESTPICLPINCGSAADEQNGRIATRPRESVIFIETIKIPPQ